MSNYPFILYSGPEFTQVESVKRAEHYYQYMDKRRSMRFFSDKHVPENLIRYVVMTASTAPSGAHKQPWTFCVVGDPSIKKIIRKAAEDEEYLNYHGRMSEEWLKDLAPFETDWHKDFLEIAPWLIVVFKKVYDLDGTEKKKNYYVNESVGIASGLLIAAIHHAGLVTLTHTPSPMNFLQDILNRPENEKAFLLLPVGYPADNATVPDLKRKEEKDVLFWYK